MRKTVKHFLGNMPDDLSVRTRVIWPEIAAQIGHANIVGVGIIFLFARARVYRPGRPRVDLSLLNLQFSLKGKLLYLCLGQECSPCRGWG